MAEIGERVARMEGELKSVAETVFSIKGYLERGAQERTTNHTLVIERLTRSETKQDLMAASVDKYQADCTADRKAIDGRMAAVETTQSSAKAVNGAIAAAISGIMVAAGLAVDYFRKG